MRQARIGGDDGIAQGLDDLGLHVVGQVAACLRGGQLAPAVLDLLFLGDRVVDAREKADPRLEGLGQRAGTSLALGAVLFGQQVQRGLDAQFLAIHVETQPRDGLVEQLVPRGRPHGGLVVQELLQLIRQLVGLHRAHPVQHRAVAGEVGIGGHQRFISVILDAVELEAEEDQRRGGSGDRLLHVGHELGARGVGGVLVVAQPREGHQAARDHVDLLVALHAGEYVIGAQIGQIAFVIRREICAFCHQPVSVAGDLGRVRRGVEVAQVPFRQVAQVLAPGIGMGIEKRSGLAGGEREHHQDLV